MKTAIYLRISTDKQELENQLQPLLEFASKKGFEVYRVYKDIITGKDSSRQEFNATEGTPEEVWRNTCPGTG